jgi:hypothetical protein
MINFTATGEGLLYSTQIAAETAWNWPPAICQMSLSNTIDHIPGNRRGTTG